MSEEEEKKRIEEGENFIDWCICLYLNKVKKYLDEGKDINYFSKTRKCNGLISTLEYHSSGVAIEIAILLLNSNKCELNMKGSWGRTVLHFLGMSTFSLDTFELFKKIIHMNGIDLNIQDDDGRSLLMILSSSYSNSFDIEAIKLLINDKRCDLNLEDNEGRTALMLLSKNFDTPFEIIVLFLKNERCDLNLKNKKGRTALWYACMYNCDDYVMKFLLNCGNRLVIDQSIEYPRNQDIIDNCIAKQRNKIGTLLIFVKKEPKINTHEKRQSNELEENPLKIIPNELIHLILSYSYPLVPQTKYCLN